MVNWIAAAIVLGATLFVTTELVAIITFYPISIFGIIIEFAPIYAFFSY